MLISVVDTGIVISSSSDEEVAPEPENEDVIITSDTEEGKGMTAVAGDTSAVQWDCLTVLHIWSCCLVTCSVIKHDITAVYAIWMIRLCTPGTGVLMFSSLN